MCVCTIFPEDHFSFTETQLSAKINDVMKIDLKSFMRGRERERENMKNNFLFAFKQMII